MTAPGAGSGRRPGARVVVRLPRLTGLLVAAVIAAGVVVTVARVVAVPVARSVQWGLLTAGSAVALGALARLPVRGLRWPEPPETPAGVAWHGLRSAEGRVRRAAGRRNAGRRARKAG